MIAIKKQATCNINKVPLTTLLLLLAERVSVTFSLSAAASSSSGIILLWYQAGRVDFINGNFDEALLKFDTQIQYFGDQVPNVYYMIGLTNGFKARTTGYEGDWKKAEEGFQKSITFFRGAPWPYVDLAWIYFSQGKI